MRFWQRLTVGVACTKAPNDAQLTSNIQNRLVADSGLQGKQLGVKAEEGTVTLTGTVDNDAQRDAAGRYAAAEPGVKQVINNLQVAAPPPPAEAAQVAPPAPVETPKPSPAPYPRPGRGITLVSATGSPHPRLPQTITTHLPLRWLR